MNWKKIVTSGYFWLIVGGVIITIWIANAPPKSLDNFTKFLEQTAQLPQPHRKKKKKNVYEEKCRKIFERIFRAKFPTTRKVKWLKNPETGRALELDGYNPNIKTHLGQGLAFEYDGPQHAAPSPELHGIMAHSEFSSQFRRDMHKNRLCKEHGVLLIRIHHLVDADQIENFIIKKLKEHDLYPGRSREM